MMPNDWTHETLLSLVLLLLSLVEPPLHGSGL